MFKFLRLIFDVKDFFNQTASKRFIINLCNIFALLVCFGLAYLTLKLNNGILKPLAYILFIFFLVYLVVLIFRQVFLTVSSIVGLIKKEGVFLNIINMFICLIVIIASTYFGYLFIVLIGIFI